MFIFAREMKKRLYIFHLWVATLAMLLSTVMMHHHHYDRICMVLEQCAEDGNLNDEHTEHHENEQEGCRVHQMHHFVINAKVVKDIRKHISNIDTMPQALLPTEIGLLLYGRLTTVGWQETAELLDDGFPPARYLRGPPVLSLL